jgi:Putative peptidoglycan binding domain
VDTIAPVSEHVVRQGEHLAAIAEQHGFADSRTIWNHPRNAELKKTRDPDVLLPGDRVFVPDLRERTERAQTESRHRFVLHGETLALRLVVEQPDRRPAADVPVRFGLGSRLRDERTRADGLLERAIPRSAGSATLIFSGDGAPFEASRPLALAIGALDPIDTRSGQEERLRNLGYYDAPPSDGDEAPGDAEAFRSAVEEFQCDHGLQVDGVLGAKTRAKLREAHGS